MKPTLDADKPQVNHARQGGQYQTEAFREKREDRPPKDRDVEIQILPKSGVEKSSVIYMKAGLLKKNKKKPKNNSAQLYH